MSKDSRRDKRQKYMLLLRLGELLYKQGLIELEEKKRFNEIIQGEMQDG